MRNRQDTVIVGMSGGVDSSAAAAILKNEGYCVIGVSMNLITCDRLTNRTCCAPSDRLDARAVCEKLGIEYYVVDIRKSFQKDVIDKFLDEYLKGRTPSPCILCNQYIKFAGLIKEADRLGAKFIATGHYAKIDNTDGSFHLRRARDSKKDQSYFLFRLTQEELARTLFPLGSLTKAETRKIAQKLGIKTHNKPESQEICFVPDDDYISFIEERAGARLSGHGNFVDKDGKVLGQHKGIHAYTIGQRKRLSISIGKRRYVVGIDPVNNTVTLGDDSDLMRTKMIVSDVTWIADKYDEIDCIVRIRSTHIGEPAHINSLSDNRVEVEFEKPVRAITSGQAAVFYVSDEVVGGGWID